MDQKELRKLAGIQTLTESSLPQVQPYGPSALKIMVGDHMWAISYSTVVAYRGPNAPEGIRPASQPQCRTTAKQMGQMGVSGFRAVQDREFEQLASL